LVSLLSVVYPLVISQKYCLVKLRYLHHKPVMLCCTHVLK